MIKQFLEDTALLVIDVQKGVDVLDYYGMGDNPRRNNPDAEDNMLRVLNAWRQQNKRVAFTRHDSRENDSPLKLSLPTGEQKAGFEPTDNDMVIVKDVNSGFVGTSLEIDLRRAGIKRLVVVGFFTNFCVETTARMVGNMGFDVYLVHDACATTNRTTLDGIDHDPETVHNLSVANMHGEFCTAITTEDALRIIHGDADDINRAQGNE